MTSYPPPDATREQVAAWERERSEAHQGARCAGCGERRDMHGPDRDTSDIVTCPSFIEPTVTIEEVMKRLGGTAADVERFKANSRGRP